MTTKKINGKVKGSGFELKVSKILTKWSGQEFHRVPMSGGLRWQVDNNVTGDIVAPADLHFPISVECKKVEIDWDFSRILAGTSEIWTFWSQATRDSERLTPKEPWLIFTKNFRKIYVMMTNKSFDILKSRKPKLLELPRTFVVSEKSEGVILPFEDVLEIIDLNDTLALKVE